MKVLAILMQFVLFFCIYNVNGQNLLKNPGFNGVYGTVGEYEGCAPNYFYNPNWGASVPSIINLSRDSSKWRSFPYSQKAVINKISEYSYFAQTFKIRGKKE